MFWNTRKTWLGNGITFFKNENPITLELACGKGEYTVALSAMHPERNFIGVDLKGNRIYTGASQCTKNNQLNAAFLRTQIDKIDTIFYRRKSVRSGSYFPIRIFAHQGQKKDSPIPAFSGSIRKS